MTASPVNGTVAKLVEALAGLTREQRQALLAALSGSQGTPLRPTADYP